MNMTNASRSMDDGRPQRLPAGAMGRLLADHGAALVAGLPKGSPPELQRQLLEAPLALFHSEYQALRAEQLFQLGRRAGATGNLFALLGTAMTAILLGFTAAALVGQPLIGLYLCVGVTCLVPPLVLGVMADAVHADSRVAQLGDYIGRKSESLLPEGLGWDADWWTAYPSARWWRRGPTDRLAHPEGVRSIANRILIASFDLLALLAGTAALIGTLLVGPAWTLWIAIPCIGALGAAVAVTLITTRLARR